MPALQHYLTNYKDEEVARSEFRKARTVLRTPRTDLPPMTIVDTADQALLDLLANFARTLGPVNASQALTPIPPLQDSVGTSTNGDTTMIEPPTPAPETSV
jgi:hypothetical protein